MYSLTETAIHNGLDVRAYRKRLLPHKKKEGFAYSDCLPWPDKVRIGSGKEREAVRNKGKAASDTDIIRLRQWIPFHSRICISNRQTYGLSIYHSIFYRDNVLRRSSCLFYKAWNSDPYFTKSETKKKPPILPYIGGFCFHLVRTTGIESAWGSPMDSKSYTVLYFS